MQCDPKKVEVFDHEAIDGVARLFINELPDDFCSIMGPGFLRRHFLPYFLDTDPHIGYTAQHQDQIVGFVLGAKADGYYRKFSKKHFTGLAKCSMAACFRDIRKLSYIADVGRVMYGADSFKPSIRDLELLYIAVAKSHQGTGVGISLVEQLLRQGRQLGFDRCVVKTLTATEITNQFYQKCGFEPLHHSRGRIWYSNAIAPAQKGSAT